MSALISYMALGLAMSFLFSPIAHEIAIEKLTPIKNKRLGAELKAILSGLILIGLFLFWPLFLIRQEW